ncbi:hypothetical protein [Paracoccus sp. SSK6]|uniref:hypothetical protein n=1 Tax=Paracoccus sp. SSK6 TaxID=3143131 RepID=UPI00321A902D
MPTPQSLEERGLLVKIEVELDPDEQPQRLMYAHARVITWLEEVLPELESDNYVPGALKPEDQADALFYQFISGTAPMQMAPNCLRPEEDGVWELRTHDLRFFGWFWRKGVFIIAAAEQAKRCKDLNLYAGYRNQSKYDRENLDLDPPKFTNGALSDVL